jgi:hypothetical protein
MIFSCAVRFSKNKFKSPDLSLPPCIDFNLFQRAHPYEDDDEGRQREGQLREYLVK